MAGISWRPRLSKSGLLAATIAAGLGFAIAAQVRSTSTDGLDDLRQEELIRILDSVDQDGARLHAEVADLTESRNRLLSNTTSVEEAQAAARQRLDSLGILAGTVPARGSGIQLTITDPDNTIESPDILDAVQELRDAGAEAIQINDSRVVAGTYFTDDDGIAISGTSTQAPYVIRAIGDSHTLSAAMQIPGGVSASIRRKGGQATIDDSDDITITAVVRVAAPKYARPVPSATE